ncbi:hypothetical protein H4R19_001211 [Coemansia spiralis]|nr:hypothetical protein H4R19_001211 [Coemansia spiralis]
MHISDFPDDILLPVFRGALSAPKSQSADIKNGLVLLSVCRRWREAALPIVYDTVFAKCGTEGINGPENVDIKTTLDLVVDAKCLHRVRKVVIEVYGGVDPFLALAAVTAKLGEATDEWAGVRRLKLMLCPKEWNHNDCGSPAVGNEDDIEAVSISLAALMPGLREMSFRNYLQSKVATLLFGRLVGLYANQLQVLHSNSAFTTRQDLVFAQLRDVDIGGLVCDTMEYRLPRLDPEAIESFVMTSFTANVMWSMFCTNADTGYAITFPRLKKLELIFIEQTMTPIARHSVEKPWALQFPAVKHLSIVCRNDECPSMENAVFPVRLESLTIEAEQGLLRAIAGAKMQVSRSLTARTFYFAYESDDDVLAINRIFAEAGNCRSRKLQIESDGGIPFELFTYKGFTHMNMSGLVGVDDMIEHIRWQPELVSLEVLDLTPGTDRMDFSIPEYAEHEPVAPLDTQIRNLNIIIRGRSAMLQLETAMVKYLLLRIQTLRYLTAKWIPREGLQEFIDNYVKWYPHLASVKLVGQDWY